MKLVLVWTLAFMSLVPSALAQRAGPQLLTELGVCALARPLQPP